MDPAASSMVGREPELAFLDAALARLAHGGSAFVVRGEPGIGKSALLEELSRRAAASGVMILKTVGVRSEVRLPFAGLHQLLRPVLERADGLAAPQRDALHAAFGLSDADASDFFRIALGTLELLSDCAVRSPVLVLADDLQWLDSPTCEALAFVARRLEADSILLIGAIRDGSVSAIDAAGLRELRLTRLDAERAEALFDATSPTLPSPLRKRILEEAAGNPLALMELPIAVGELHAGTLLPASLPLTRRLEQAFAARTTELPPPTRMILLAAALNDGDALTEAVAAASAVAGQHLSADHAIPAVSAALLDLEDSTVRFRHPLVRSAIHQAASLDQVQQTHAALAAMLATQPERRVWHRAAAIIWPDDDLALELELTARRPAARRNLGRSHRAGARRPADRWHGAPRGSAGARRRAGVRAGTARRRAPPARRGRAARARSARARQSAVAPGALRRGPLGRRTEDRGIGRARPTHAGRRRRLTRR